MCAKDKQTATENFRPMLIFYRLGKKSEKSYGGGGSHPSPPPPVRPRVKIKLTFEWQTAIKKPLAGAPSVAAWRFNCALKWWFQLTQIQSSKRVYSNLIEIVLLFRGGGKWGARKME